jgi:hypothetical protein
VIEVQLVGRTADDAIAAVSLPNSQLYGRWDNPPPTGMDSRVAAEIFLSFHGDKFKLKHFPFVIVFLPRVDEVEYAIVRPYTLSQFLVDSHPFWGVQPILVALCSLVKFSVLRKGAVSGPIWLIN